MSSSSSDHSSFTFFYDDWSTRQESLFRRLDALSSKEEQGIDQERECSEIIPRALSHYDEFFREKARVAAEDVFLALSPPWMSSFERSLMWVSDFRPSMMFPMVDRLVAGELSEEGKRKMEAVKAETRRREKEITEAMARAQESVAESPVQDLLRRLGRLVDGEVTELEEALEELKAAMVAVVDSADELRGWVVAEVFGLLSPVSGVKILAAAARFQLQARNWGRRRDAEREAIDLSR